MNSSQKQVLQVLREHGPMADVALVPLVQHVAQVRMSSSSIRSRRAELARDGDIHEVGTQRLPSGRSAIVWAANSR